MSDIDLAKPTPFIKNKPGVSNWVEDEGGLPPYIREVANALVREHGWTQRRAIATAVNRMRRWVAGQGGVKADTRAKAAKALAQWAKMRASRKGKKAVRKVRKAVNLSNSVNMDKVRQAWSAKEDAKRDAAYRKWDEENPLGIETGKPRPRYRWRHVREMWNDSLIIEGEKGEFWRVPFTVDGDGNVSFGAEKRVKQEYIELTRKAQKLLVDERATEYHERLQAILTRN